MGKVLTSELRPGMRVGADVYNDDGKMIVPSDTVLTDNVITRLEFHSVLMVEIVGEGMTDDDLFSGGKGDDYDAVAYFKNFRETPEFKEYKKSFDEETEGFKEKCNAIVSENAPIETEEMLDMVGDLLVKAQRKGSVFDMLHSMRDYDDESFAHSINVSLIANVFCHWLKMSEDEINLATMCGLFHDIGKTKVPREILRKSGRLSDDERRIIQRHTVDGFRVLENLDLNIHVKNAALMHHERYDGSGYPLGIKGTQIDPYARIISICDVYDAITSPRVYRAALCPFTAIEIFEEEGLQKYDIHYIMTFLENVVYTYVQRPIRLSDGREGQIVKVNPNAYSRPLLKVDGGFLDLREEKDLHIKEVL
ncbi:MAG: HD-GYP domain-containing protein [Eubacterium sp.]|nr:HD-GYP domain-containing protein [Eubacterium sp.]